MEEAPRLLRESLKRVAVSLKESGVPFALGGSYAGWARGGPEPVHDVDFIVMPDDVPRALEALAAAGLRAVDPPEDWLAKVYDGEVLVDVIHHPVGRPVSREMLARAGDLSVDSVLMPVLDATDLTEMTLLALDERFCDLARVIPVIRAMREQVDWARVRVDTSASPFAEAVLLLVTRLRLIPEPQLRAHRSPPPGDEYFAGDLRERLAVDNRVAELGLDVAAEGDEVTIAGVVDSEQRRRAVAEVVAEAAPGVHVYNDVTVAPASRPPAAERQP